MLPDRGIEVGTHDLAAVVDVEGEGLHATGKIERGEVAVVQQEATPAGLIDVVDVAAYDLTTVMHSHSGRVRFTGPRRPTEPGGSGTGGCRARGPGDLVESMTGG